MTPAQIIRGAIPDASDALCEHILWGRTPYPCGQITAKSLYRAASRLRRAAESGRHLCDFCDNLAEAGSDLCGDCASVLRRHSFTGETKE